MLQFEARLQCVYRQLRKRRLRIGTDRRGRPPEAMAISLAMEPSVTQPTPVFVLTLALFCKKSVSVGFATTLSPVRTVLPGTAAVAVIFPAMRAAAAMEVATILVWSRILRFFLGLSSG